MAFSGHLGLSRFMREVLARASTKGIPRQKTPHRPFPSMVKPEIGPWSRQCRCCVRPRPGCKINTTVQPRGRVTTSHVATRDPAICMAFMHLWPGRITEARVSYCPPPGRGQVKPEQFRHRPAVRKTVACKLGGLVRYSFGCLCYGQGLVDNGSKSFQPRQPSHTPKCAVSEKSGSHRVANLQ